jgi:hypothetical protein
MWCLSPSHNRESSMSGDRRRHAARAPTLNPNRSSRPMRSLLSSLPRDSGHVSQKALLTRSFPMRPAPSALQGPAKARATPRESGRRQIPRPWLSQLQALDRGAQVPAARPGQQA